MKIEELIDGIGLETDKVEFKKRLGNRDDQEKTNWLKEIVAFANSSGGNIYIGVDDKDHKIHPLSPSEFDKTANLVYSEIKSRIEPKVSVKIKEIPVPDATPLSYLMKIEVPKYGISPVFLHYDGIPVAFIRKFGRSEACDVSMLRDLFLNSENVYYDSLDSGVKASVDALSIFSEAYEKANGTGLTMKALQSYGLVNDAGNFSKGGYLFSDSCKDDATLIKMSQFHAINRGGDVVLAEAEFKGPIQEGIKLGVAFIKAHSVEGYRKTATGRINIFSYPERALLEAVVNAFAHRNYFIDGSQISIDIFPDRVEITSPGSLGQGLFFKRQKDLGSILPKRRNPIIASGLRMINLMEEKGTGFQKIEEDYREADENHKPFIDAERDFFRITLPDLSYKNGLINDGDEPPELRFLEGSVAPYDKQILTLCYLKPLSVVEIASKLGVTPSTFFKKRSLQPLIDANLLKMGKSKRAFTYSTNKDEVKIAVD